MGHAYLGQLITPAPRVCMCFHPRAASAWTAVLGGLAAAPRLPRGARVFTEAMAAAFVDVGDVDLLASALRFFEAHAAELSP